MLQLDWGWKTSAALLKAKHLEGDEGMKMLVVEANIDACAQVRFAEFSCVKPAASASK